MGNVGKYLPNPCIPYTENFGDMGSGRKIGGDTPLHLRRGYGIMFVFSDNRK